MYLRDFGRLIDSIPRSNLQAVLIINLNISQSLMGQRESKSYALFAVSGQSLPRNGHVNSNPLDSLIIDVMYWSVSTTSRNSHVIGIKQLP